MSENKPYKPSKKKLERARHEGKVLKSQLLTQSALLIISLFIIIIFIKIHWKEYQEVIEYILIDGYNTPNLVVKLLGKLLVKAVSGFLLLVSFFAVIVEVLQVGFNLDSGLIGFKIDKLNPITFLSKIKEIPVQALKIIFRLASLSLVFYWFFATELSLFPQILLGSNEVKVHFFSDGVYLAIGIGGFSLLVLGSIDYFFSYRKFYKELSMSYDEIKREHREDEGDPMIKSVRHAMHESILMQDIVHRIRKSKVVVVKRNNSFVNR